MQKAIAIIVILFIVAGFAAFFAGRYTERSVGEIADLNQRYDQLNREYTERQRIVESNVSECIGYVESAREIAERTGENTIRAISNLQEAKSYIEQGIEERKNIEMELDRLRAALCRIRDMDRMEHTQIDKGE